MNEIKRNGFNDATKPGHHVLEDTNNKNLRESIFISPKNQLYL